MLKNIDPVLSPELLFTLRAMGHGDEIAIVDGNYPAQEHARRLVRADGHDVTRLTDAILSVMPLDTFVDEPALRMEIVGNPHEIPKVQAEVQREIDRAEKTPMTLSSIERFAFYERAKKAYCVIQTGERRFYGCFIFKKGVVPPK